MINDRFEAHAHAFKYSTTETRPLEVRRMTVSLDMDRVPFVTLSIVIAPVDDTTWQWLDPRQSGTDGGRLLWGIDRWNADTENYIHGLPFREAPHVASFPAGNACIRRRRRNILTGEITIEATSYEVLMEDKRRVASTVATIATATNLFDMVLAALADCAIGTDLSPSIADSSGASGVAVPAGDRRLWLQGQSWTEFYESELAATGRRLYDSAKGNDFHITFDTAAPLAFTQPSTIALTDGVDGQIIRLEETTDRDDWADGVLVKFQYVNGAGTNVISYQPAPAGGANTKARFVTESRPAPSSSFADRIRTRTLIRGRTYELEATAELQAHPGQTVTATVAGVPYVSQIRSVEFRYPDGEMTIRSQLA
jgi:hypothetical protein